jgi:hypothetical protein
VAKMSEELFGRSSSGCTRLMKVLGERGTSRDELRPEQLSSPSSSLVKGR